MPSPSGPSPRSKSGVTCAVVPSLLLPFWVALPPHGQTQGMLWWQEKVPGAPGQAWGHLQGSGRPQLWAPRGGFHLLRNIDQEQPCASGALALPGKLVRGV